MSRITTKEIVLNGLLIALVFLTTFVTRIPGPIPPGYINFGDIVIMVAAIVFGKKSGLIAGALGSFIADIACNAFVFAPITLIVKGLEGYVIGMIASKSEKDGLIGELVKIAAVVVGAVVMIGGYFIAEMYIIKIFDNTFGYAAAISELPLNLVQGGVSVVVGYVLSTALLKANVQKYLTDSK